MTISYQADGSVVCLGNADPTRTATYVGPRNSTAQIAAITAFFVGDQPVVVDNSPEALRASIPTPATAAPPAVSDSSAMGMVSLYARADHTHASKARKQRVTGISTATYVWTYLTPFGAGVVPIVQGIAEDPASSAIDSYNVQVVGAPTATQATFRIIRQTSGLFGLLAGAIGFNTTPGNINLHLIALEP